ncbi:cold shock domain-containing protein [Methylocystis sp.]|jgi:cold shock CspA family protein|uniref:cold shock domain-containing protein n=1 Tax=Methylocystis sp. TaxID=1911079 RepID=UPI002FAC06F9
METTPQIDFHGVEPSPAYRDQILRHIERLEDKYGRMTSCRVAVMAPSGRHRTGGLYEVHIHLVLPDEREVAIDRTPDLDERFQRFEFALNDAFGRAGRQLQDEVRRMRGKVKRHEEAPTGVVKRVMREDGYGFLESDDGREIYFHRNSVGGPGFDNLEIGVRVNFVEEEGREGPQASRVMPIAEKAPE